MDLKLPPLGEGVDSGSVVSVLVKEGDVIAKGQGIIELETGKAVAPVPAAAAGKVTKILVAVGDKVSVGQTILSLEGGPATAPASAPAKPAAPAARPATASAPRHAAPPPAPAEEPVAEVTADENLPPPGASPSIRRMARELGIDLRKVRGSASGGRIVIGDVRAYIQRLIQLAARPPAAGPSGRVRPPSVDFTKWGSVYKRPVTQLRKIIAERMSASASTVARVTQFHNADITAIEKWRRDHAAEYEKSGARLTFTALALKVIVDTLKKHPVFNSSLDEDTGEIVFKEYYHIGMAVDTEQGLLVPVLRDVDKKDLLTLARELADLAVKARERKVSLEELQGGTFTVSNQGGIGGGHFTPIINLPEVAILGLGRSAEKPVVRDAKIEPRLILPLALSYDHRVIDGGSAARFVVDLAKGLETFDPK